MTLLNHLAVRRGLAKKRNPNARIDITLEDAEAIIVEFRAMKAKVEFYERRVL